MSLIFIAKRSRRIFLILCAVVCFIVIYILGYRDLEVTNHYIGDRQAVQPPGNVRILCFIFTTQNTLANKAKAVRDTWAVRCNKFIFFSSVGDASFPVIKLNVGEGREHLTAKTMQAFRYCYEHYGEEFDWFLKADDDTYVIVENLRHFLQHHNPNETNYFGHKFKQRLVKHGFNSGGAGYIISRKALHMLVLVGMRNPSHCKQDGELEDLEIGKCMEYLNITSKETLDHLGRETFHPYSPLTHVHGRRYDLLSEWSWHAPKKGWDCCSQYSISFHYMSPDEMYFMHFMLYHMRAYGVSTIGIDENIKFY